MTRKRSHDRKRTSFGRIMYWSSYGILFYKDSGDCRGGINGGTFVSAGLYGNRLFVSGYRYRIFDNQPQITQISKICMQIYRTSDGDAQFSLSDPFCDYRIFALGGIPTDSLLHHLFCNGIFVSFNLGFFYERRHSMDVSNQTISVPFTPNAQRIIISMADCFCISICVF